MPDIFDFDAPADMSLSRSSWDVLADFVRGQDDIDLSTLDAKVSTSRNDAFAYIGNAAFSAPGQVRYVFDKAAGYGILYGSTDGDVAAEFALQVLGVSSLSASDLIA